MTGLRLQLIGSFGLHDDEAGEAVTVSSTGARVLALLALHRHGLTRACAGGILWPEANEERATANVRSALWRLKTTRSIAIVDRQPSVIGLSSTVRVDVDEVTVDPIDVDRLLSDLVEDWEDEWVQPFRLRWRQTRLHTIDAHGRRLMEQGELDAVVALARTVLAVEPLRESILRLLVTAEINRGRPASAAEAIDGYRYRLKEELGADASPVIRELARSIATSTPFDAPARQTLAETGRPVRPRP